MNEQVMWRDYEVTFVNAKRAEEMGLANAEWYRCPIPRAELKELMKRRDGPAIRDTAIWFAAFIVSGVAGYFAWGTWWAVPFFIVYGVLYGASTDSRWHECGHGTAFKTRWMNERVYQIASFMVLREPTVWRWSHTRHHTDTIIVGRDPEIAAPRPPDIAGMLLNVFALKSSWATSRASPSTPPAGYSEERRPSSRRASTGRSSCVARIWTRDLRRGAHPGARDRGASCRSCMSACRRSTAPGSYLSIGLHPARRPRRGRARPPAQLPHRLHEPGGPLPLSGT